MDELQWLIAREIPHLHRYALALLRNTDAADDSGTRLPRTGVEKAIALTAAGQYVELAFPYALQCLAAHQEHPTTRKAGWASRGD